MAAPFKELSLVQKRSSLNFSLEACHGGFAERQAGVMWDSCQPAAGWGLFSQQGHRPGDPELDSLHQALSTPPAPRLPSPPEGPPASP